MLRCWGCRPRWASRVEASARPRQLSQHGRGRRGRGVERRGTVQGGLRKVSSSATGRGGAQDQRRKKKKKKAVSTRFGRGCGRGHGVLFRMVDSVHMFSDTPPETGVPRTMRPPERRNMCEICEKQPCVTPSALRASRPMVIYNEGFTTLCVQNVGPSPPHTATMHRTPPTSFCRCCSYPPLLPGPSWPAPGPPKAASRG
jgi:hypothetical protein